VKLFLYAPISSHYVCSIKYRDNFIFFVVCLTMLAVVLNDWMVFTKLDGKGIKIFFWYFMPCPPRLLGLWKRYKTSKWRWLRTGRHFATYRRHNCQQYCCQNSDFTMNQKGREESWLVYFEVPARRLHNVTEEIPEISHDVITEVLTQNQMDKFHSTNYKSSNFVLCSNFVLFYVLFVLCRCVYCLYVNVYCTTATGWQPNCS
jgi:hypothetical protein